MSSSPTCSIHPLVHACSASLLLPEVSEDQVNRIYDLLGPTPRLCLELISDKERLEKYEDEVTTTILEVTADKLENMIRDAASLTTMDQVSHKICLISREDRYKVHSRAVVAPITLFVQSKLANRFRNLMAPKTVSVMTSSIAYLPAFLARCPCGNSET